MFGHRIFSRRESCGTVPWSMENWYHLVYTGASSSAASLNIAVEMLSSPVALRVFNIVVYKRKLILVKPGSFYQLI